MPSIELSEKNILLTKKNKVIFQFLEKTCEEHAIKEGVLEGKDRSTNESLIGKFFTFVNSVVDRPIFKEGSRLTLSSESIHLDAQAYIFYRHYQDYLNAVLVRMNVVPAECEAKDIVNKFVVLREILLRIVATALKGKSDDIDHGEKVISLLIDFVVKLNKGGTANEERIIFPTKLNVLSIALAVDHQDWIEWLKEMVRVIKVIHAPATIFSSVLNYLERSKLDIVRYIIAYSISDSISDFQPYLSENWLMTKFAEFENSMLREFQKKYPNTPTEIVVASDSNISWRATKSDVIQSLVLEGIKIKLRLTAKRKLIETIEALYQLLYKTNLLFSAAMQMESLIHAAGWVPIIAGFLNINNLQRLLEEHEDKCRELLKPDPELFKKDPTNRTYIELLKHSSSYKPINIESSFKNLTLLNSTAIQQELFKIVSGSIHDLRKIDGEIDSVRQAEVSRISYPLVNTTKLPANARELTAISFLEDSTTENSQRNKNQAKTSAGLNKMFSGNVTLGINSHFLISTHIYLTRCEMGDTEFKVFADMIKTNESILVLDLYGNELQNVSNEVAEIVRRNKNLLQLNLGWNYFDDKAVTIIAEALQQHRSVKQLSFYGNRFSDNGMDQLYLLFNGSCNGFLEELDIGYCSEGYFASYNSKAGNWFSVKTFLERLEEMAGNCTLTTLHLTSMNINDFHVPILISFIQKSKKIQYIDLSGNRITAIGIKNLVNSLTNDCSIKEIYLSAIPSLTEKDLQETINNNRLKNLKVIFGKTVVNYNQPAKNVSYYKDSIERMDDKTENIENTIDLIRKCIKLYRLDRNNKNETLAKAEELLNKATEALKQEPNAERYFLINFLKTKLYCQVYLNGSTRKEILQHLQTLEDRVSIQIQEIREKNQEQPASLLSGRLYAKYQALQLAILFWKKGIELGLQVDRSRQEPMWILKITREPDILKYTKKWLTLAHPSLTETLVKKLEEYCEASCEKYYPNSQYYEANCKTQGYELFVHVAKLMSELELPGFSKVYACMAVIFFHEGKWQEAKDYSEKSGPNAITESLNRQLGKQSGIQLDRQQSQQSPTRTSAAVFSTSNTSGTIPTTTSRLPFVSDRSLVPPTKKVT